MSPLKPLDYVQNKKMPNLGIGIFVEKKNEKALVKFWSIDADYYQADDIEIVNLPASIPEAIPYKMVQAQSMTGYPAHTTIIFLNEVREFVGIGWITIRQVTIDDFNKYPIVK